LTDRSDSLRSWLALLSTANGLKKNVDTRLRVEFGLSISRFDVMAALGRAGSDGLRAGAMSQQLMVTEGNVTQVTAPLIRDGIVARASDKQDGRVAIFRLTRKGVKLFRAMAESHRRWIEESFADLSPSQLANFRRLLDKIDVNAANPTERNAA